MLRQKNVIGVLTFLLVLFTVPVYLRAQNSAGHQIYTNTNPPLTPTINPPSDPAANYRNNNSGTKYYLLKTNYIVEGVAKFDGKTYDIKTSYGSVKIPSQNVLVIGQSRDEIYKYKKTQLNPLSSTDCFKFAEWCVSNNFLHEAVLEYESALPLANDHVTADIIGQRIIAVKKIITEKNNPNQTENNNVNNTANNYGKTNLNGGWTNGANVRSNNDQIKAAKNLTENFKRHVQPILMKNCAVVDCHSGANNKIGNTASKKFMLLPNSSGGALNFAHENLNRCLLYVDLDYPMRSGLLNFMIVPHARYSPPFNVESDEYSKVVAWVQLAAKNMPLIKSSELANFFSNVQSVSPPDYAAGTLITAEHNTTATPAKLENRPPIPAINLPAGFKEVVDLQKQVNNKNSYQFNVTKNHSETNNTNQPTTQNINNNINNNNDTTSTHLPLQSGYADFIVEDKNGVDGTDPMIFNKIYHPNIAR
ncbi:MAG: hypothetical protein LBT09_11070 [Planctomycetaceae bacterium]|jgi:hypothetical protein|nr:hypothetical protein [Planctomycetaceae bacterium]